MLEKQRSIRSRATASCHRAGLIQRGWSRYFALGFTARLDRGAADHVIPSLSPPEPMTSLWILPSFDTWEGLAWTRESRWTILPASRPGLSF
jgi:hypothetical protein